MSGAAVIEAILLRWGETHSTGRTVTFLLPDEGGEHPFKSLKCGPDNGQRVALSVALIADDETQIDARKELHQALYETSKTAKPAHEKKRWSDLALSAQAAIRCNEPGFQLFINARFELDNPAETPERAAQFVREYCAVKSRKDINRENSSGMIWAELDNEYQSWLRGAA